MNLSKSVTIITGAKRGLGYQIAKFLVEKRSFVVMSDKDSPDLFSAAKELNAIAIPADVSQEEDVYRLVFETVHRFGRLDLFVNNAGIWFPHGPVEEMDAQNMQQMMAVNFFGTFFGSRQAIQQMKKQGGGTVMNILSVSALYARPFSAGYCATKFAASGFTRSLREEVASENISVLGVYPGHMKTELYGTNRPEGYEDFLAPADVARKIVENLENKKSQNDLVIAAAEEKKLILDDFGQLQKIVG